MLTRWKYQGERFTEADGNCGFVYLVTCHYPGDFRLYLGRKFFYSKFGTKTMQKETDWKKYKTSSGHVVAAIEKYGEDWFDFEILQVFKTRGGVVAAEAEYQWAANVLHTLREEGQELYWNRQISGVKWIPSERADPCTKILLQSLSEGYESEA